MTIGQQRIATMCGTGVAALIGAMTLLISPAIRAKTPADAGFKTADAASILAANHAAVGDLPQTGTIRRYYVYSSSGLIGAMEQTDDMATGAFIDNFSAGPVSGANGYDGEIPWMRDASGANTAQEGGDRVQVAVNEAYRNGNLWWPADRGGAVIAYAGRETADGAVLDRLSVTPKGGKTFDAWFDAGTHLLARIAEPRQFFKTRAFYSEYAREGGVMLAHLITLDPGVGKAHYETLKLNRATVGPAQPLTAYARPTAPPTGMAIDRDADSVTLPFRLLNNHIYVEGTVNGKGPYTFIVDTGGHTLLSPRVVAAAGLDAKGAAAMSGAGEKVATSGFAKVKEIALGGLRMHDQTAVITPVYDPAIEGIPVDGMVGFELFRRFAVRIDYGAQMLTITDPARFNPIGAGTPVPFKFYDYLPFVEGKIGDMPARFDIDTGSRSELDVTSPTVAKQNLRAKYPTGVNAQTGWGVGGPVMSYVVRLPSITLGDVRIDGPVAALDTAKAGSMSDPNFEGNIGSALLKRFAATFDYAHQTMYLKPITPVPPDAGRFDRSGLWINAGAGGFSVMHVDLGGPAAQAGVVLGDVITALDGKPARPEELSDIRTMLRTLPPGTRVALTVRRGGANRSIGIILRDQI
jgi:hypothetical protein